jgi:hypothetical protein
MLGTHMPIKIASFVLPLKNNISEYTNESIAEIKSNLSVSVNFLNIFLCYHFLLIRLFRIRPVFFSGFWSPRYMFISLSKLTSIRFIKVLFILGCLLLCSFFI